MQGLEKMRLGSLEGERRIRQQWVFYVRGEKTMIFMRKSCFFLKLHLLLMDTGR